MKRIGILTGGGDCPGLNNAVKWVVNTALDTDLEGKRGQSFECFGINDGWHGIVEVDPSNERSVQEHIRPLFKSTVRTWDRYGGTMLGTSRTNPFNPENDQSEKVISNMRALGFDVVIAIGGEDTLGVAAKLKAKGMNMIGIPKTIDLDLPGTEYCLGFESAVSIITEEVDRLRTTAGSHERVFVIETMGRHAGWLALEGGKATGAFIILIPEYEVNANYVCDLIKKGDDSGLRYEIIIVAEGCKICGGEECFQGKETDDFGHKLLGGVGERLAKIIKQKTGHDTRHVVLSHLQRGGPPSAYDRRMGRAFGIAAVDLIAREEFGKMVSYKDGRITYVDLETALGKLHTVDVDKEYDKEILNGPRELI